MITEMLSLQMHGKDYLLDTAGPLTEACTVPRHISEQSSDICFKFLLKRHPA